MAKPRILLLAVTLGWATASLAEQPSLTTAYAANSELCAKFLGLYRSFKKCSLREDFCFTSEWDDEVGVGIAKVPFQELAVNQSGYTSISLAEPQGAIYSVVHIQRFEGDRQPRLIQTWKVNRQSLNELLLRTPQPLRYEEWVKGGHGITRDTLAAEFAALLQDRGRINEEWEPTWAPIFEIQGRTYAVTKECAGSWRYGGDYDCAQLTKLTVKRLSPHNKPAAICQYVRPQSH